MKTMFIAGWNIPGCIPEMEPVDFSHREDAVRFLVEESGRFWDEDYEAAEDNSEREEVNDKWQPVADSLENNLAEGTVFTGDRSLAFWVALKN